jgi:glycolate dehydrogenase iron-sulfur subunit
MEPEVNENLLKILPNDDVLSQCIHCGMCLSVCPTYELTHLERSSPRGRIKLIKAVAKKDMSITETFKYEMNFCLDCQACETACPAGVEYGYMVEASRDLIAQSSSATSFKLKKFLLNNLLGSKKKLKFAARLLYIYQNYGVQQFLRKIGLFKLLPQKLDELDKMSPRIPNKFSDSVIPEVIIPKSEIKFKTAVLTGCLMNVMFSKENVDTVEVLRKIGAEIFTPKGQVCCGSLHAHNGEKEFAKKLAKQTIDIFSKRDYDTLVCNSAGCAAFMKEYRRLLKDDFDYSDKAKVFSNKVQEFTEFIAKNISQIKFVRTNKNITYHDACHLVHTQKIFSEPRKILEAIPGLLYTELEESTWCCGSAGIYNILQTESSIKILERKMNNIKNSKAKFVITGNPGCISQLRYGAKKFNVNIDVIHPATLLKSSVDYNDNE